jgi:periplasmic protein TonB
VLKKMVLIENTLASFGVHALMVGAIFWGAQIFEPSSMMKKGQSALWIQVDAKSGKMASLPAAPAQAVEATEQKPQLNQKPKQKQKQKTEPKRKVVLPKNLPSELKATADPVIERAVAPVVQRVAQPVVESVSEKVASHSTEITSRPEPAAETRGHLTSKSNSVAIQGGVGAPVPFGAENGVVRANEKQLYYTKIMEILQRHKQYPNRALELDQQGTVRVHCRILPDGSVVDARIVEPSRYQSLNDASLALLQRIRKFPPLPQSLASAPLSFILPIRYFL